MMRSFAQVQSSLYMRLVLVGFGAARLFQPVFTARPWPVVAAMHPAAQTAVQPALRAPGRSDRGQLGMQPAALAAGILVALCVGAVPG